MRIEGARITRVGTYLALLMLAMLMQLRGNFAV